MNWVITQWEQKLIDNKDVTVDDNSLACVCALMALSSGLLTEYRPIVTSRV